MTQSPVGVHRWARKSSFANHPVRRQHLTTDNRPSTKPRQGRHFSSATSIAPPAQRQHFCPFLWALRLLDELSPCWLISACRQYAAPAVGGEITCDTQPEGTPCSMTKRARLRTRFDDAQP